MGVELLMLRRCWIIRLRGFTCDAWTRCLDASRTCYMESLHFVVACIRVRGIVSCMRELYDICNSECDLVYKPPASSQVTRALSLELTGWGGGLFLRYVTPLGVCLYSRKKSWPPAEKKTYADQ